MVEERLDAWKVLFRRAVAKRGWFVYANGRRDRPAFGARLEFTIKMIPYEGDDGWVEGTLMRIRENLRAPQPPEPTADCEYCAFAGKWAGA